MVKYKKMKGGVLDPDAYKQAILFKNDSVTMNSAEACGGPGPCPVQYDRAMPNSSFVTSGPSFNCPIYQWHKTKCTKTDWSANLKDDCCLGNVTDNLAACDVNWQYAQNFRTNACAERLPEICKGDLLDKSPACNDFCSKFPDACGKELNKYCKLNKHGCLDTININEILQKLDFLLAHPINP